MRKHAALAFVLVAAFAVAAGCSGHSSSVIPGTGNTVSGNRQPTGTSAQNSRIMAVHYFLVEFRKGQKQPVSVREYSGPMPKSLASISFGPNLISSGPNRVRPLVIPSPEPTPWCPQGAGQVGTNDWNYCQWVPPQTLNGLILYCSNCTSLDNPLTLAVSIDPAETPPPNFVALQELMWVGHRSKAPQ
jgi:hypothetical protein